MTTVSAALDSARPWPAPFERRAAAAESPIIYASPHSGRHYPEDMLAASRLDSHAIRRSEDAHVDALLSLAPGHGAELILAGYARAYVDLNRDPWELDPAMFEDRLPDFARARSQRVAAGLGVIPRVVGAGREIYARKLTLSEARTRIDRTHAPYHEQLALMLAGARARHGTAILIDWHSMPAAAAARAGREGKGAQIVLGDRFGAACTPALTSLVERELGAMGYEVTRNAPYAGGYTTERHGKPAAGAHALQIEIDRALYMDETSLAPTGGIERLRADIARLTQALAASWPAICRG